jgi:hypothetical protein
MYLCPALATWLRACPLVLFSSVTALSAPPSLVPLTAITTLVPIPKPLGQ